VGNQIVDNLTEFIKLLLGGELDEDRRKIMILQNLCKTILNTLNPSIVIISLYDQENQFLTPFFMTDDSLDIEILKTEVDVFDSDNPYTELFSTSNATWLKVSELSDKFPIKKALKDAGVSEVILTPILYENNRTIGVLNTFLTPDTKRLNVENYFEVINDVTQIVSVIITSWVEEYNSKLKQKQTELVVEMSNLTLETTEIQVILNSILPKVEKRTGIDGIGVFIKDVNQFSLVQHIGLNDEIEKYYSSPDLDISNLIYYNAANEINEVDFGLFTNQYGVVLPIGSTNLMLGFLVVLSSSLEKLSESNIHFLRIVTNQLFLTLQRKRLLDDIRQITQTSEFSSFPIILVNNKNEIIYLNKQAEKTFNINHDESIGVKLDYSLELDPDRAKSIMQKTREVIANIAKDSMKLDIEVLQAGKKDTRTFFVQLSPTINNLTGEYCVVLSLVDISEATKLQSIAEEYSNRSRMYLNVLTHDIYNILFGISGYYELLKDNMPEEDKPIIERVRVLVRRGTGIVQDIRLLSNVLDITTGAELNFIPLRMTLSNVIEKIEEDYYDKKISISVEIPSYVKVIGGAFLHDMFLYVVSSLIQKTERKEVKLEITGKELTIEGEDCFEIEFIDREGTPPQLKEEIHRALDLSPFDETVRRHLGFMIVNEIAKKYNYQVTMEDIDSSDWKKGNAIKIIMPISVETEKEELDNGETIKGE
ncbi:MAG: HAMP domain-containing histidine kinase, partial [Candidatus Heimdallarchaeota archaeon]|nr:HAMP domain-containing histidine kinase [Candidatus Heimdallarchaeota archaeon]MCK4877567.1 HAMP domain-containing histidine kinase [Candidatus Heimdallarchaeota archaeon]